MKDHLLIEFPKGCLKGTFLKRIKRFTVEVLYQDNIILAHSNNTGSMLGLTRVGSSVLVSPASNPERKLGYTLELCSQNGIWIGVNTMSPNRLLKKAFERGLLPWALGYTSIRLEAVSGDSRIDALLTAENLPPLWVECKNVTLVEDGNVAFFPDAVSDRASKHLAHMISLKKEGARTAFFYCIQRNDAKCFAPADFIDKKYADIFYEGLALGVEAYPYKIIPTEQGLHLGELLPIKEG